MDDLRWILLAVAVVIVAAVYFFGRARKKDQYDSPLDAANDIPSFSVEEDLDNDWKDGVGPVRVVSLSEPDIAEQHDISVTDDVEEALSRKKPEEKIPEEKKSEKNQAEKYTLEENKQETTEVDATVAAEPVEETKAEEPEPAAIDDVISVFVLATQDEPVIKGEKILSASYALHLEHGDMKIFHRYADTQEKEIQFSMANLLEPGWFNVDEMHQMETRGLSFFMQVNLVENPSRVLDDMLICAHSMATMLGAQLCNAQRKPLDEAYTNNLRDKVKHLMELKAQTV